MCGEHIQSDCTSLFGSVSNSVFEDLFFEILVRRDEKGENQLLCKENVLFLHCKQRIKHCNMSTTTLQIRIDEGLKEQAVSLFERLGLDLPTAIRIFLKKSVSEDGIPFDVREKPRTSTLGLETLLAINAEASKAGKVEMTEEEIEAEIAAAHSED